jgi:hypothetical protein
MSPGLQKIESEGKVFIVFVGGLEWAFAAWRGLEMTAGSFIENSRELQQFSIRCSCRRGSKDEVATSSPIPRARVNLSGPRLLRGRRGVEESMRSQRGVNLISARIGMVD